jgi:hypothetical protein
MRAGIEVRRGLGDRERERYHHPLPHPDALHTAMADPAARAIAWQVQCVVSPAGSASINRRLYG